MPFPDRDRVPIRFFIVPVILLVFILMGVFSILSKKDTKALYTEGDINDLATVDGQWVLSTSFGYFGFVGDQWVRKYEDVNHEDATVILRYQNQLVAGGHGFIKVSSTDGRDWETQEEGFHDDLHGPDVLSAFSHQEELYSLVKDEHSEAAILFQLSPDFVWEKKANVPFNPNTVGSFNNNILLGNQGRLITINLTTSERKQIAQFDSSIVDFCEYRGKLLVLLKAKTLVQSSDLLTWSTISLGDKALYFSQLYCSADGVHLLSDDLDIIEVGNDKDL